MAVLIAALVAVAGIVMVSASLLRPATPLAPRADEEEPELERAFPSRTVACWLPREAAPSPPSRRTAHTAGVATTNDSSRSSSYEEGLLPTHKGGTA